MIAGSAGDAASAALADDRRAVVFDFGAVLFRWQPARLLMQVLPHRAVDEASARHVAAALFEDSRPGTTWGGFDRGVHGADEVAQRMLSAGAAEVLAG